MREIKDESDEDEAEGVEADVDMTLHGGVSFCVCMCQEER